MIIERKVKPIITSGVIKAILLIALSGYATQEKGLFYILNKTTYRLDFGHE